MDRWQPIDLRSDPYQARFEGDPAEIIDAAGFILELYARPSWHRSAACRGQTPAYFPERGERTDQAKATCAGCSVRSECLEAGLGERHGIWGGMSEPERRQLRNSAA